MRNRAVKGRAPLRPPARPRPAVPRWKRLSGTWQLATRFPEQFAAIVSIGGGDPAEVERIVDDRREEVDGEQRREVGPQAHHRRVIGCLDADEQVLGHARRQSREDRLQVTRTQFGGSTRLRGQLRQSHSLHGDPFLQRARGMLLADNVGLCRV